MISQIELNIFSLIALGGKEALQRMLCNNITADQFGNVETKEAWKACLDDYNNYGNINMSRVATHLITQNRDGNGLANQINATYAEMSDIDTFCDDLHRENTRRKAWQMAQDNLNRIENSSYQDIDTAVELVRSNWQDFGATGNEHAEPLSDVVLRKVDEWQEFESYRTIPYPFERMTNCMQPIDNELILLLARPSIGKTALTVQWLFQIAKAGYECEFFTLESSREALVPRMVANQCRLNTMPLQWGRGTSHEYDRIREWARSELDNLPLNIVQGPMTMDEIESRARIKAEDGCRFFAIDNATHIDLGYRVEDPVKKFMAVAQRVKTLRDRINKPVLLVHHLGQKGQISWSDDFEKAFDHIWKLKTTEITEQYEIADNPRTGEEGRHYVQLFSTKNRDGMTGFHVDARYRKHHQYFSEIDNIELDAMSAGGDQ